MELSLAPLQTGSTSLPRPPSRPTLVTMTTWRDALNGTTTLEAMPAPAPIIALVPHSMPTLITAPPKPDIPPAPGKWERARSIFTSADKQRYIHLDQHAWDEEFKVGGDWNHKPSRIETFLARYDKNQTLTTLAVVVLLLLWIF
jgi:hypothetical protein